MRLTSYCVALLGVILPSIAAAGGEGEQVFTSYAQPTTMIVSTAQPAQSYWVAATVVNCCCSTVKVGGFMFTTRSANDKMVVMTGS